VSMQNDHRWFRTSDAFEQMAGESQPTESDGTCY
jgi:hypothetical protein